MPRTLTDEDGKEVEVPTEEETQKAIDDKVAEATKESTVEFEKKMRTDYEIPEGTSVDDYVKELKDSGDPNWKEARRIMKNQEVLIEELKKDGKTFEDGKIIDKPDTFSKEDGEKQSREVTKDVIYNTEKSKLLAQFTEEEKKVIEVTLDKLIVGEDQTMENLYKYAKQAVDIEYPAMENNPLSKAINSSGGGVPRVDPKDEGKKDDYSESDEGKEAGKAMNLGFAQEKPKSDDTKKGDEK